MFIPALLAVAGTASGALGIGATLLGSVAALSGGLAQAKASEYNAKVSDIQAKVAEDQAAAKYSAILTKGRHTTASNVANTLLGGGGIGGSNLRAIEQSDSFQNLDALTAIYEGNVRATGYRNEATQERTNAKGQRTAAYIGAGSKLVGGISQVYSTGSYNVGL